MKNNMANQTIINLTMSPTQAMGLVPRNGYQLAVAHRDPKLNFEAAPLNKRHGSTIYVPGLYGRTPLEVLTIISDTDTDETGALIEVVRVQAQVADSSKQTAPPLQP